MLPVICPGMTACCRASGITLHEEPTMLRVGQIEYANCTPLFAALKKQFSCSSYHFVSGVPAELNAMLRRGEIDVCPSSSIEYAKNFERYVLLPGISISSVGPVKSVLLFSRFPIEHLDQTAIGLTTESDTSVNLLKILLARHFNLQNRFERTALPLQDALEQFSALLLIGDAALREGMTRRDFHVYDLGELWYRFTGLPFVFALWIATREAMERRGEDLKLLSRELLEAKRIAYDSYGEIAAISRERAWIDQESLVAYWRTISYELTPLHLEGATTFFREAREIGLLEAEPEIRMFQ
jgi:chorismate dehydratase